MLMQSSHGILQELVPGPLQIPRSMGAQVPYVKWHSALALAISRFCIHRYREVTLNVNI